MLLPVHHFPVPPDHQSPAASLLGRGPAQLLDLTLAHALELAAAVSEEDDRGLVFAEEVHVGPEIAVVHRVVLGQGNVDGHHRAPKPAVNPLGGSLGFGLRENRSGGCPASTLKRHHRGRYRPGQRNRAGSSGGWEIVGMPSNDSVNDVLPFSISGATWQAMRVDHKKQHKGHKTNFLISFRSFCAYCGQSRQTSRCRIRQTDQRSTISSKPFVANSLPCLSSWHVLATPWERSCRPASRR